MQRVVFQTDWGAVRRCVRGTIPGGATRLERGLAGQALLGREPLDRREPVAVIGRAVIRVARALRALDLLGKRRGPLRPGEQPAGVEGDRDRESLRLPRG